MILDNKRHQTPEGKIWEEKVTANLVDGSYDPKTRTYFYIDLQGNHRYIDMNIMQRCIITEGYGVDDDGIETKV